jgi:hypothetical protein
MRFCCHLWRVVSSMGFFGVEFVIYAVFRLSLAAVFDLHHCSLTTNH